MSKLPAPMGMIAEAPPTTRHEAYQRHAAGAAGIVHGLKPRRTRQTPISEVKIWPNPRAEIQLSCSQFLGVRLGLGWYSQARRRSETRVRPKPNCCRFILQPKRHRTSRFAARQDNCILRNLGYFKVCFFLLFWSRICLKKTVLTLQRFTFRYFILALKLSFARDKHGI